ncbi:DUF2061 domain-containing protein [Roseovarius atlanticus]|uniref:DUF2061 domain-containing protein n=1 Tax=Roseovarius atlanticus TaxID=1641875 RepID=UPI001C97426E|nr:DUF2061 domain-containing protein [Roseovarius atlanticus]MBY5986384.1 DUF2061 domain-containing protein [Roseovarius atlanticus]MBY6125024.1 DUF2061 domain-containing protein [Roseovarius atlanticus]MBY6150515.1 DUF2061 domain-containing protein [Roseovarius atlanticus]
METNKRTLAKAATWQVLGLMVMTLIGFIMTGSVAQGGTYAVITAAIGFVTFFLHERIWAGIGWGRRG